VVLLRKGINKGTCLITSVRYHPSRTRSELLQNQ
jgi:hypothetical protein